MGKYICDLLGYDKILMMNSGSEACETALKIARRWGYRVKKVPEDQAEILIPTGAFWGRSFAAMGASEDPKRGHHFGPFGTGFTIIKYNDIDELRRELEVNPNICAYMVEAI